MTELIPVKRPDSTGKMVTRWVRADGSPASGASIPGPRPVAGEAETLATAATMTAMDSLLRVLGERKWSFATPLIKNLSMMPDSLGQHLIEEMDTNESFANVSEVAKSVDKVYGLFSTIPMSRRATVLRNMMSVFPSEDMIPGGRNSHLVAFGRGVFGDVGGYNSARLFSEEESRVYASVAAITATIFGKPDSREFSRDEMGIAGFNDMNGRVGLRNSESVRLLLEHPSRIEGVRVELQKRRTLDPEIVRLVIDGGVFRDGAL